MARYQILSVSERTDFGSLGTLEHYTGCVAYPGDYIDYLCIKTCDSPPRFHFMDPHDGREPSLEGPHDCAPVSVVYPVLAIQVP